MLFLCNILGAEKNRIGIQGAAVGAEDTEGVLSDGMQCVVRRQPTHLLGGEHCLKRESASKPDRMNINGWKHKNDRHTFLIVMSVHGQRALASIILM